MSYERGLYYHELIIEYEKFRESQNPSVRSTTDALRQFCLLLGNNVIEKASTNFLFYNTLEHSKMPFFILFEVLHETIFCHARIYNRSRVYRIDVGKDRSKGGNDDVSMREIKNVITHCYRASCARDQP